MYLNINIRDFLPQRGIKNIEENDKELDITYYFKANRLPKAILFDEELSWFLGLRKGDRAEKNNGSVGICNTDEKIIENVIKIFVNRFLVPPEKIKVTLLYKNKENLEKAKLFIKMFGIREDNIKCYYNKNTKLVVIAIYIYNIVLRRVLDWLQSNIEYVLSKSPITVFYAYQAGYFDADGCADKISNCFSWRTVNIEDAILENKLLQKLGFNSTIQTLREKNKISFNIKIGSTRKTRANDFKLFVNLLPYLKNFKRSQECLDLLNGNRVRRLDIQKYLPIILCRFKDKPFKRASFCKVANLSKASACRILKALREQQLVSVIKGDRIRKNDKFCGQEPDIYVINTPLLWDFVFKLSNDSQFSRASQKNSINTHLFFSTLHKF